MLAAHRDGVGVLEPERTEHADAVVGGEAIGDLRADRLGAGPVLAAEHVRPQRAGVVDADVEVAGDERVEHDRRAEAFDDPRLEACVPQFGGQHASEHELLGERLRADPDRPFEARGGSRRRRGCRRSARFGVEHRPREARGDGRDEERERGEAATTRGDGALDEPDHQIEADRQRRARGTSDDDHGPVAGLQAAEDEFPEAAPADGRRQRRGAHRPDRRSANARYEHRHREGKLHDAEPLPRRHAHRGGGLEHGRVE